MQRILGERIVQKFGGAALANVASMREAARIVAAARTNGQSPCVVVSAMGDTTDELITLSKQCGESPVAPRELDALMACGEAMSAPLFAMFLQGIGIPAISFSGAQAGIHTTSEHGNAKLSRVSPARLLEALEAGLVPVTAGFQGIADNGDTTTLGRGGSDLTAAILGVAINAKNVMFYKDVQGIYSSDPTSNPDAVLHKHLCYDELLDIIAQGGHAVLHERAVRYAQQHRMPLHVLPFKNAAKAEGTFIDVGNKSSVSRVVIRGHLSAVPNPPEAPASSPRHIEIQKRGAISL